MSEPDWAQCSICFFRLTNPSSCISCGVSYCVHCWDEQVFLGSNCPSCRVDLSCSLPVPNIVLRESLEELPPSTTAREHEASQADGALERERRSRRSNTTPAAEPRARTRPRGDLKIDTLYDYNTLFREILWSCLWPLLLGEVYLSLSLLALSLPGLVTLRLCAPLERGNLNRLHMRSFYFYSILPFLLSFLLLSAGSRPTLTTYLIASLPYLTLSLISVFSQKGLLANRSTEIDPLSTNLKASDTCALWALQRTLQLHLIAGLKGGSLVNYAILTWIIWGAAVELLYYFTKSRRRRESVFAIKRLLKEWTPLEDDHGLLASYLTVAFCYFTLPWVFPLSSWASVVGLLLAISNRYESTLLDSTMPTC